MNVAIILARGGSKRIPQKNIKAFRGQPIISWPIKVAINSNLFSHVIVSTDDEKIAKIAKEYGAEVPFTRPADLADDYTGTIDVVRHAILWLKEKNIKPENFCCLYATSVFFKVSDLLKGYNKLISSDWSFVFSATEYEYSIFRSFKKKSSGGVEMWFPNKYDIRSQDLPLALHDAAQFYWGTSEAWLKNKKIFDHYSYPVKLPYWKVQDIDTEDDWSRAEILFDLIDKQGSTSNEK